MNKRKKPVAKKTPPRNFLAGVRYTNGEREVLHIHNVTSVDEARKVAQAELRDTESLLILVQPLPES